uniref:Teneurin NHL domain-containing protein n=1 Tax=Thermocrispum agreste TaxID=37925 RepID=A0A2W4ITY5_9PSEU|nr:MAG: hypothetical protein DIU77_18850 [Thermocrispum agreste]
MGLRTCPLVGDSGTHTQAGQLVGEPLLVVQVVATGPERDPYVGVVRDLRADVLVRGGRGDNHAVLVAVMVVVAPQCLATVAYANDNDLVVFAGTGTEGFSGDGGPASQASLHEPTGVAVGGGGTVYISDSGNFRVRAVSPNGTISTVAGTGQLSRKWSGPDPVPEGASGTEVEMIPGALAVGPDEALYIADNSRAQVLALSRDGWLSVVAGSGAVGFSGDGGPATEAKFRALTGLAVAPDGTLYIGDKENLRLRAVSPDGVITTVAGNGRLSLTVPAAGGPATSIPVVPIDVAVDGDGAVWIVGGLLRRLASGRVSTITRPAGSAPNTWGLTMPLPGLRRTHRCTSRRSP